MQEKLEKEETYCYLISLPVEQRIEDFGLAMPVPKPGGDTKYRRSFNNYVRVQDEVGRSSKNMYIFFGQVRRKNVHVEVGRWSKEVKIMCTQLLNDLLGEMLPYDFASKDSAEGLPCAALEWSSESVSKLKYMQVIFCQNTTI